mmetsp:Transcript_23103/g.75463  ORF Transcript_23103/g.75463 Transcript_23103/m.75463 type:complete len:218 (-) Transcript_23103:33-686(-)
MACPRRRGPQSRPAGRARGARGCGGGRTALARTPRRRRRSTLRSCRCGIGAATASLWTTPTGCPLLARGALRVMTRMASRSLAPCGAGGTPPSRPGPPPTRRRASCVRCDSRAPPPTHRARSPSRWRWTTRAERRTSTSPGSTAAASRTRTASSRHIRTTCSAPSAATCGRSRGPRRPAEARIAPVPDRAASGSAATVSTSSTRRSRLATRWVPADL